MKHWQAGLTAFCLASLSVSSSAHDTYAGQARFGSSSLATNNAAQNHSRSVVHARFNPWRTRPGHINRQQQVHQHAVGDPLRVQPVPSVVQPAYSLHPLYQRQVEYRDYVHHYNTPYGFGSGLPWWSDPVAVPYGPWAFSNGWPGGIW
jgi:hypothetical protein